jgi:transcriptional regulator with XRE-family HTH domain
MRKQRRYSDEFRAQALAALLANGGNLKKTAAQLGLPRSTLGNWANGTRHPDAAEMADKAAAELADRLGDVAHRLIGLLPDKIPAANLHQVAIALFLCIDKAILLRRLHRGAEAPRTGFGSSWCSG